MTIREPAAVAPAQLLDYEQLAAWLNDSVRHLRRLVDEDRIPYHHVGHYIRFDPEEIRQWLEDNRHGPAQRRRGSRGAPG